MGKTKINLPYFDMILGQFQQNDTETMKAFGRHVHWGYWENPGNADGSSDDFAAAAENLCQRVCDAALSKNTVSHNPDGQPLRILDAGCGFGGTIASLNDRFERLNCVGLNIDERQLIRARDQVKPRAQNQIEFVEGDACQMPFPDASFDMVLAVECIFHFPSRERFFQEAKRVLKPGGILGICDFVPLSIVLPFSRLLPDQVSTEVCRTYGRVDSSFTIKNYRELAHQTGFTLTQQEDITRNTIPTYPFIRKLFHQMGYPESDQGTAITEWISRLGFLRYLILVFESNF